jgi:hypothetical protein
MAFKPGVLKSGFDWLLIGFQEYVSLLIYPGKLLKPIVGLNEALIEVVLLKEGPLLGTSNPLSSLKVV